MSKKTYCIIMAGGIGSRFWPLSTRQFPKQFQDILGTGRTMIQQTYDRISRMIPPENIYVITHEAYTELTRNQLPDIPLQNIVGEPMMKNTSACNIYMINKIKQTDPDANLVVLPADHLILQEDNFLEKLKQALQIAAEHEYLITLGIKPTRPDIGYGYIQFTEKKGEELYKVKTFTEKPSLEIAKSFIESGDFLWNSGIFIWNLQTIAAAFEKYLPEIYKQFGSCEYNTAAEKPCIEAIYPKISKISIDNGILEKAENVYVIPAEFGWSDLGTWTSIYENAGRDEHQNSVQGKPVLLYNAEGNIIRAHKNRAVVIDGLKDYIVVDTDKALLICPRSNDQLIKEYVTDLKNTKGGEKLV